MPEQASYQAQIPTTMFVTIKPHEELGVSSQEAALVDTAKVMKPANQKTADKKSTAKAIFLLKNLPIGLWVRVWAEAEVSIR